jgi:hypothetical protein
LFALGLAVAASQKKNAHQSGFVRFLQGHHLLLITERRKVGSFGPHAIYAVENTATISIAQPESLDRLPEMQAKSLRNDEARCVCVYLFLFWMRKYAFRFLHCVVRSLHV